MNMDFNLGRFPRVRIVWRLLRDESGVATMTYVVVAVLVVAAVAASVMAFGGALGGGVCRAGKAAGGQVGAAADDAAAARESYEAASARAIVAQSKISGGELAFVEGGKRGGQPTSDGKGKGEHKVNHPVAVEIGHTVLDLAGLIPGIGDAVDLANAAWYEKDGRHVEAAITAAAAVPVAGTAAVVVKWGNNAGKLAKLVFKDGKLVKIITQEGKVLTKEGGKIASDTTKVTGKTGEKVAEKTAEKNSGNVIDINAKRMEKNGTPDNVVDGRGGFNKVAEREKTVEIRQEPIFRKNGTTGENEIVGYRDVRVENTKVNGTGQQNGNPFADYRSGNSNIDTPVNGVSRPEAPSTVKYNDGSKGKYDPNAVRKKGEISENQNVNNSHNNVNNPPSKDNVVSFEEWQIKNTNNKNPKAQEYNNYNRSKTASEQYENISGQKNGNVKRTDTDNKTP